MPYTETRTAAEWWKIGESLLESADATLDLANRIAEAAESELDAAVLAIELNDTERELVAGATR